MLNKVGFTLSELAICEDTMEFKMVFTSEDSEAVKYELTKTPINLGPRLQIFEIDEGTEIDFAIEGYYSYEIYQTTANNLVEVGLLRVVGSDFIEQTIPTSINPQVYGK